MTKLEKIRKIIKAQKISLSRDFDVDEIGLFGSYVRGEQKKKSDLDVVVEFSKIPGLIKFIKLENYLTDLVRIKVDLVRKKAIRKELKDLILKEVMPIW